MKSKWIILGISMLDLKKILNTISLNRQQKPLNVQNYQNKPQSNIPK